ncbi:MAG: DUF1801 domain-containing protein [Candidatus Hydrogenedentes bacterium]|nr:DUF1801 domain-containing protein [Candidatus Hydrogenedentota bacterium]
MESSNNKKVNKFMDDLQFVSPCKVEMIESIRTIFLSANHELTEGIMYGGLVFKLSGELIAGIFPYKEHISIEFSHGVDFRDPSGVLEGKGKKRRHLKIIEKQDIDTKNVGVFVAQALI